MPEHDTQPAAPTPEEREAQLAAREAALAAREAELAAREAEAAQDPAPAKGGLLNNGDPHFKNEKEKIYDHFPLSVHQMDILIGVLVALIVIFWGSTRSAFSACFDPGRPSRNIKMPQSAAPGPTARHTPCGIWRGAKAPRSRGNPFLPAAQDRNSFPLVSPWGQN